MTELTFCENDLDLYVMGAFEGDQQQLEDYLASNVAAREYVARQAQLELLLRETARAATFCPSCDDVVEDDRCAHCGAAARAGGYTIEKVLVQTAHGRLYLATDADGQRVALKELAFVQSPDAEALAMFEREAKFLRALEHPAIPRFVAAFGEGEGVATRLYLAQQYIEGEGLDRRLANHFFTEEEVVDIARQVLDVLKYLQSISPIVVHRDIKPANLVRREDGTIAVVDFGAALDQGQTMGSTAIGTYGYMPLEQMAGIVDSTTDLYGLGASLWHLLTRQEPWKILGSARATDSANVSEPMERFLSKLTAAEVGDRYPSAAAALEALENREAKAEENALVVAGKKRRRPKRETREHRGRRFFGWPFAFTAVSVVALGVGSHIATTAIRAESDRASANLARTEAVAYRDLAEESVRRAGATNEAISTSSLEDKAERVVAEAERELARELGALREKRGPAEQRLPAGQVIRRIQLDGSLGDALLTLAAHNQIGVVIPEGLRGKVTATLKDVPANVALETILDSKGLWYGYEPAARVAFIARRAQLDGWSSRRGPALPDGARIDLAFDNADIRNVLGLLADQAGVNVVIPEGIRANVTVRMKSVPWDVALRAILASSGLWYGYTAEGKVVRVGRAAEF